MKRSPTSSRRKPSTPLVEVRTKTLPLHLDPLSLVLDAVRLRCMAPGAHEMTAPWGVRFEMPPPQEMRRHAISLGLPPPPHDPPAMQGSLLAVVDGGCWIETQGQAEQISLLAGDLILLTRDTPYTLRDNPETPARHVQELIRREHIEHHLGLRYGGGGAATTFLGGSFFFEDEQDNSLLASLPPVIHVCGSDGASPWLDGTLKLLTHELAHRQPGSQSIINHLAHVLFVQAIRACATRMPEDVQANWLFAMLDQNIAPTIGLMHLHPEEPWTVASLAERANLSRSAFAARFDHAVGQPPLLYLTHCRMRKARSLLRDSQLGLKAVAAKVGYGNESSFSNAFKRMMGQSPGIYRRLAIRRSERSG